VIDVREAGEELKGEENSAVLSSGRLRTPHRCGGEARSAILAGGPFLPVKLNAPLVRLMQQIDRCEPREEPKREKAFADVATRSHVFTCFALFTRDSEDWHSSGT
jgi:hypothetical protein